MVDVSGGVESAAGIKDQDKVVAFIDNAKST
jgi:phosphoribosylanthranilate isomerase